MFVLIPAIESILHTFENVKIIPDFDSSLFILHPIFTPTRGGKNFLTKQ